MSGSKNMRKLVVVGNGMAGVACVEQILKYAPRFRDHDLRRRDARQLQPHPAVVGAGRREGRRRHRAQPLDWYQQNNIRPAPRQSASTDVDPLSETVTGDDGSRHAVRQAAPRHRQLARSCRRSTGIDKDERLRVPHARRHARAARSARGPACKAVVIGGGLLGLEAARGLQVQGCDVTVVHLMDTLMERQLDPTGGVYLTRKMEDARHPRAARPAAPQAILGNGDGRRRRVRGRQPRSTPTSSWSPPASGRTSISAARPASRSIAASSSTTTWRPRTPTSSPSANASSTTASATAWSRRCSNRAKCWRRRSPATRDRSTRGTVPAAKLKIMGVDVFSAGDWSDAARRRSRSATKTPRSASTRSCWSATASSPA